jgi:hypothetical protein
MATIVNAANCAVAALAGGAWSIAKSGGTNGAFDASAVSAAGIAGALVLRAKPLATGNWYVGVSTNPAAGVDGASIAWAIQMSNGLCRCVENGVARTGFFPLSTYAWIRRSDGVLQYLTGADLATAVVKRSIADPGGALFFDSSLATAGGSIEVKLDPIAPAAPVRHPRRRLTLAFGF